MSSSFIEDTLPPEPDPRRGTNEESNPLKRFNATRVARGLLPLTSSEYAERCDKYDAYKNSDDADARRAAGLWLAAQDARKSDKFGSEPKAAPMPKWLREQADGMFGKVNEAKRKNPEKPDAGT